MEIVQGIVLGANAVVRQAGAMLKRYLPVCAFAGKRIAAYTVLPFVGIVRFGGDADDFISQNIADVFTNSSGENLSLGPTLHFPEIGQHLPVVLDPVFQQGAFIIHDDDQIFSVILWKLFGFGAGQFVYFFENTCKSISISRESLTAENQRKY